MSELNDGEVQPFLLHLLIGIKESIQMKKGLGNEKTSEEFVLNLSEHLRDCKRVLNDRGSFWRQFTLG